MKYLNLEGLKHLVDLLKEMINSKVEKVDGKGLSTVDFTTAYETKLKGIKDGAEVNKIDTISVNGSDLPISGKKVDIEIPDVSEFQTAAEVESAIASAIKGIQGIKYSVVTALPQSGEAGTIYLVSNSGSGKNIYDEYIWITDKFELLGTTEVDLTGYVKDSDLVAITTSEIDELFAE